VTSPSNATVVADGVSKQFGSLTAVDGLTFDVREGEIFGFLGPNGAGKSTTIRMLCGLIGTTSGTARVAGYDVNKDPGLVRQHIGYMSQRFSLYRDLTVAENIRFFGGVYGLETARLRGRYEDIVKIAGLEGLENELTGTLSGALAQRLALGCAIIHEPPILFLDEPTSGVDPISRRLFWDLVRDMSARGVTVLITTHFMDEAEFCDRIGFITAGRLVALGTPDELRRQAVDEDLFSVSLATLSGAREKIETVPDVVAATYFGQRLHVFARHGALTAGDLARSVRDTGLDVISVVPSDVTLEDAFVRLAQSGDKGGRE